MLLLRSTTELGALNQPQALPPSSPLSCRGINRLFDAAGPRKLPSHTTHTPGTPLTPACLTLAAVSVPITALLLPQSSQLHEGLDGWYPCKYRTMLNSAHAECTPSSPKVSTTQGTNLAPSREQFPTPIPEIMREAFRPGML